MKTHILIWKSPKSVFPNIGGTTPQGEVGGGTDKVQRGAEGSSGW